MRSLGQVLDRFNRKERNFLVREILGHEQEKPLQLTKHFRDKISEKLGIRVPEDAWWATDYHINWLAGALVVLVEGDAGANETCENPVLPLQPRLRNGGQSAARDVRLIEANQEDVDLVIASGDDLIMIEAKAYGHFANSTLAHKLLRLRLLHDFYERNILPRRLPAIRFHLLLVSRTEPTRLVQDWPTWALRDGKIPWIELKLAQEVLTVNSDGRNGWSVVQYKH